MTPDIFLSNVVIAAIPVNEWHSSFVNKEITNVASCVVALAQTRDIFQKTGSGKVRGVLKNSTPYKV